MLNENITMKSDLDLVDVARRWIQSIWIESSFPQWNFFENDFMPKLGDHDPSIAGSNSIAYPLGKKGRPKKKNREKQ